MHGFCTFISLVAHDSAHCPGRLRMECVRSVNMLQRKISFLSPALVLVAAIGYGQGDQGRPCPKVVVQTAVFDVMATEVTITATGLTPDLDSLRVELAGSPLPVRNYDVVNHLIVATLPPDLPSGTYKLKVA